MRPSSMYVGAGEGNLSKHNVIECQIKHESMIQEFI